MNIIIRFIIGGLIYVGIEVMYDNTSDRSMALIGGMAFVLCAGYDHWLDIPYWILCVLMGITIMTLELVGGLIFNKDYKIWDYRKMPFNIKGQVCLTYFMIWTLVMPPIILWLDGLLP